MAKNHSTIEIKIKAVRRVMDEHSPVALVAKDLGLHRDTVNRWVNAYKEKGEKGLINPKSLSYSSARKHQSKIEKLEKQLKEKAVFV
ncbi:helix-turn-helix domain-containing protein [Fredinandcohnia onubensis]|uniref:helix-turn-helix domain-containing protein n=1 Tax=Fredinandcohnia onubensis TaxID=1571209 RepID=UPI0015D4E256|nr:helix-turn-helix domain-containing protein [Fredinandcohnia onubensis]